MSYTRSFEGYVPPRRYDGVAFTQALIREAATEGGSYTTIDTITLSPVDSDPSAPLARNFTTNAATLAVGWYVIRWQDAGGSIFDSDPVYYPSESAAGAYAELDDVREQNTARTISASSHPSSDQVLDWLGQTAGILDAILRRNGYELPVPASASSALRMLEHFNALGAAAMVEQAAPTSDRRKEAQALWEGAQRMLSDELIVLDIPRDDTAHTVRAAPYATPMFTRDQEL